MHTIKRSTLVHKSTTNTHILKLKQTHKLKHRPLAKIMTFSASTLVYVHNINLFTPFWKIFYYITTKKITKSCEMFNLCIMI